MLTQRILVTHDVGIAVSLFNCYVRCWSAVVIFHTLLSFHSRLVWGAFKERRLAFSKVFLSIITENRADVTIHKLNDNENFHAKIFSNQEDSLKTAISNCICRIMVE